VDGLAQPELEPVEIVAPAIALEGGVAVASGGVRVAVGDRVIEGERAEWTRDADGRTRVTVLSGVLTGPEGRFVFERAEVVADGEVRVEQVAAEVGAATVRAARATTRIDEGARPAGASAWQGQDVEIEPCACEDGGAPALTLRARGATIVPGQVLVLRGATVRLFGVPVLPLPALRLGLDPQRFRLLLPSGGLRDEGWYAQWFTRFGIGAWTVTGGPAWREDRGFRGVAILRGPEGGGRVELGWDTQDARIRGALAGEGGVDRRAAEPSLSIEGRGDLRAAWDVSAISDAEYAADHDLDYTGRGVAWRESRGVLAVGTPWQGARVDVWLPDDGSAGTLAQVVGRIGVDRRSQRSEVGGGLRASVAAVQSEGGAVLARGDGLEGRLMLGADGRASTAFGPVRLGADVDAGAWGGWSGVLGAGVAGLGQGYAELPLWTDVGATRVLLWPGVRIAARTAHAVAEGGVQDLVGGPSLRTSAGTRALRGSLEAVAAFDAAGTFQPWGTLDVSASSLSATVSVARDGASSQLAADAGWLAFRAGAAWGADAALPSWAGPSAAATGWRGVGRWTDGGGILPAVTEPSVSGPWSLGWTDATVRAGRFRIGGAVASELLAVAPPTVDARVGYDDGCVAATFGTRWAADRVGPDVGVQVQVRR
jgi:hypothetical protein